MQAIPVAIKCYELMKVFFLSSGVLVFDEAVAAPLNDLFALYCPSLPYPASSAAATSVLIPPPPGPFFRSTLAREGVQSEIEWLARSALLAQRLSVCVTAAGCRRGAV
jgi:hypothetical protein